MGALPPCPPQLMRTSNIQTLPISIVRTVRTVRRAIEATECARVSVSLHPLREAKIAKAHTEESEGARFGVGEIGLRRDLSGQKRCLQRQKREIEFWEGQVRLEDIDSPKAAQNAPQSRSAARWWT